jgi:putative ABC transport system substrate-binding protein
MRRREFIAGLGGVAAWPVVVRAQQPKKVPRIGFLATGSLELPESLVMINAFQQGLRELGYVEGENVLVEYRTADSNIERFVNQASELVRLKVDIIVASNTPAARAAQQATDTIPVVVPVMGDPVRDRLVASLARPSGNITGLTFLGPELLPKRLALLKEALPTASRVVALWHPGAYGERTMSDMMKEAEVTARSLGVQLRLVSVQGPDDLERAFSTIAGEHADALLVFPSPMLFAERRRIVDLAAKYRLPSMAMGREFAELGGLITYGASIPGLFRRSAIYVDKIIKGVKPADLPVEQPTKFDLVINLKTAKALGLDIPPSLVARADEVIE